MIDLDELEKLEREATPGPWKIAITKVPSGDGEWEYQLAAERGHAAGDPYSDFELIAATRNALPDLIAELRMLRAAHEEREEVQAAWGQGLREAYEAGRRDALSGVQAACLFEMGKLELIPMEYRGPSWDWEGYPEEMRMHEAFDRVAEAAEEAALNGGSDG